ncbi:hypothetical protein CPC08DRAFT_702183 [Agrocybe pediades]|nr:hypothetical protein CPC08DRAFT_702183 [Agrocybe pediades]
MDPSVETNTSSSYNGALEDIQELINSLREQVPAGRLSSSQIQKLISDLPRLEEKKVIELGERDNFCPICFTPYLTILTEEEMALALDSPAHPPEELGVTKLSQPWQCGHMFCRRDISKWIYGGHDSCPMCRRLLIEGQAGEEPTEEDRQEEAEYARTYSTFARQMLEMQRRLVEESISFPQGMFAEFAARAGDGSVDTNTYSRDDRSEYSSMYS